MVDETIGGDPVTDQVIEDWDDEAQRGYAVEVLRKRGRKPLGEGPTSVVPVRMDASLLAAITELAEQEHISRSQAIRDAVRRAVTTR